MKGEKMNFFCSDFFLRLWVGRNLGNLPFGNLGI